MSEIAAASAMERRAAPRSENLLVRRDAAVLIAVLGLLLYFLNQIPFLPHVLDLKLPDSDDVMRLLAVRDLLAGQSWFDAHQYRYLPPEGTLMHWSRLADAPLAATVALLTPFVGQSAAEGLTAVIWPPLLFLAYAAIVFCAVRRLAPVGAAALAVLVAGQMLIIQQYMFRLGRIDHHALQIVLVAAAGLLFAFHGRNGRAPVLSGLLCALSLAVGLETLPFVAAIAILNVLAWVLDDDRQGRGLIRFAASLAGFAALAFVLQTSPALWLEATCDTLSPPWLLLACGGGSIAVALALATPLLPSTYMRLAAAASGGLILVGAFAIAFPACLAGPYEMVPEPYRSIWLGDILEARPTWVRLAVGSDSVFRAFGPLLFAAGAAAVLAARSAGEARRLLAVCAVCLAIGVGLALLQVRGLYIASAFIPVVAALAVHRILARLQAGGLTPFRAVASVCAALAFLGPAWSVPAFAVRMVSPPSGSAYRHAPGCLLKENLSRLAALPAGVVLAPIDLGAYTLLYTRHSIIAGGYHRAAAGIVAGIDAFRGSEADMRRTAAAHGADYLVICPEWLVTEPGRPVPFANELAAGASAVWLEPVVLDAGTLKVWRVRREAIARP